jgi:hypothetical protein
MRKAFNWELVASSSPLKAPLKAFLQWADQTLGEPFPEDPNLRILASILREAEGREEREEMRLRWRALRKVLLYLLSYDGAYRWRAYYVLRRILEEGERFRFSQVDLRLMEKERW